ncbi:MAG TPA: prolyl oligopeptidase family serine peptidase [Myxococcaceae bacterium]|nr:prolyl oligopeptidase family serine peptidase [Myxococcaceae bacterium]
MRDLAILPFVLSLACAAPNETAREEVAVGSKEAAPSAAAPTKKPWPPTRQHTVIDQVHGVPVPDPYRWLEDEKSPEVQAWMKAQDDYARASFRSISARGALAQRLKELLYVESVSVPVMRVLSGPGKGTGTRRFFYLRTHADREKAILYVRDGDAGKERVLLDPNQWSADQTVSLGAWFPSWNGRKVVFKEQPNAADEATLRVVDADSGEWSKVDVIDGGKYADPTWTPDSKGFFYEWLPSNPSIPTDERPGYTEIRFHRVGTDPSTDVQVHPKTGDPKTFLAQRLSRDGKYLFVYVIRGWSENDVYLKRMKPNAIPKPGESGEGFELLAKGDHARYAVTTWRDQLYLLTDEGAPRQRIFKVAAAHPERKNWKEIVAQDPQAALEDFNIVGEHLALSYLKAASTELRLATLDGRAARTIQLPSIGTASSASGLEDQPDAYFQFSSFTTPRQVYRASIPTGKTELWAKVELPIDATPFTVEQVSYPSRDGTRVSMFLVHRRDVRKDGSNPVLLYGYGGFNVSMTPDFKASIYPWLEAGGVYAVANLRGGGEYGKEWHDAGRLDKKANVFDDFIAAGEFLIREGFTRPDKLAIWGGSNGGLLVAAAMVQRPELFSAVVCAVPLIDMLRYHLFGSGRTWIPEYGSAENPAQLRFLHAYSPYQRVTRGVRYPAVLILSADHDDRVDPMHARKLAAAVQNATASEAPVMIRIERHAGHGGADQVRQAIELNADLFAFLFARFGMSPRGETARSTRN